MFCRAELQSYAFVASHSACVCWGRGASCGAALVCGLQLAAVRTPWGRLQSDTICTFNLNSLCTCLLCSLCTVCLFCVPTAYNFWLYSLFISSCSYSISFNCFRLVPLLPVKDAPLWNKPATVRVSVCDPVLAAICTVVILCVCSTLSADVAATIDRDVHQRVL